MARAARLRASLRGLACAALMCVSVAQAAPMRTLPGAMIEAEPQFSLEILDHGGPLTVSGAVHGLFTMPGRRMTLDARDVPASADLVLDTGGLEPPERVTAHRWRWRAPNRPGMYVLTLRNRATGGTMYLNVFVKTPLDPTQAMLNGYDIGHYQPLPEDRDPTYARPGGLVRVTPEIAHAQVSPHFELSDFLCHQQPDHWPKYVLVRPRLVAKLEAVRSALRDGGVPVEKLTVMSGYRTPWYNADIGNDTVYSRHLYGGAADIFVDTDEDGEMDDLNADGRVDIEDARWLADLVETVTARRSALAGGLSAYAANGYHGPFVHMDVRGVAVRW